MNIMTEKKIEEAVSSAMNARTNEAIKMKGDKVTVFKKRRRNTYRRKAGHRQIESHVKITALGGSKE